MHHKTRPCPRPSRPKCVIIGAATQRTGPVPRRHRHRLIQKEQLGPAPRRHDAPLPPLELQQAANPRLALPRPPQPLLAIMQAASIASKHSPRRVRHDLARRQHPVLQGHRIPPKSQRIPLHTGLNTHLSATPSPTRIVLDGPQNRKQLAPDLPCVRSTPQGPLRQTPDRVRHGG